MQESKWLLVILFFVAVSVTQAQWKQRKKRPYRYHYECETCEQVVGNYREGLERTKKKYFNAEKNGWLKRLRNGVDSCETRFVDIYDKLCKGIHEDSKCPQMLEEYEELIEKFWYSPNFAKDADSFHKYFCIENVKSCCPIGTWGQECKDCTGGKERPCRGNGRCDGSGWRVGNGLCICDSGYKGSVCENCDERHFEVVRNDTHTICKPCHPSCRTTCTGEGPKDCYDCGDGWKFIRDKGCKDVNECLQKPCGEKEYCANKQGSYICRECDPACTSCYGRGHTKCRNCTEGYMFNNTGECLDIDECRSGGHEDLCFKRGEVCENKPGSYVCVCQTGFVRDTAGACVEKKEEPPKPKKPRSDKKQVPKCQVCQELTNNFKLGLERTKQKHYEGGNSQWEESRLGRYPDSEMRLVEATDEICAGASKECPQILEDYEELIEEYWFKSGLEKDAAVFYKYFCIDNVKACCPNNTYGPNCTECTGGVERPCKGNGECDGEGTREGTGACNCSLGYEGELCESCAPDHYETDRNDTHTQCTACHESCKTCTGEGPKACGECNEGWFHSKDKGCQACHESCKNCTGEGPSVCGGCKEGWFHTKDKLCQACDESCKNCSGEGPKACGECEDGWIYKEYAGCQDKNECESEGADKPCSGEGQQCENTPGSFSCVCQAGYVKDTSGSCVQEGHPDSTHKDEGKKEPVKNTGDKTADTSSKDSAKSAGDHTDHDSKSKKESPKAGKDSPKSSGDQSSKAKTSKDSTNSSEEDPSKVEL